MKSKLEYLCVSIFIENFSLKYINRHVKNTLKEQEQKTLERKTKRFRTGLTKRKKLGRGRFEKFAEPALMTNELTGCLRKLPTQCDILAGIFLNLFITIPYFSKKKASIHNS